MYIVYKDKVLIRKHDKYDVWVHVGGHVELNEDPVEAAIRECKEEVGLDVTIHDGGLKPISYESNTRHLAQPAHMNIHYVGGTKHQHIDLIYYATTKSDQIIPENIDDEWIWLTKEDLKQNEDISPQVKHYALGALNTFES